MVGRVCLALILSHILNFYIPFPWIYYIEVNFEWAFWALWIDIQFKFECRKFVFGRQCLGISTCSIFQSVFGVFALIQSLGRLKTYAFTTHIEKGRERRGFYRNGNYPNCMHFSLALILSLWSINQLGAFCWLFITYSNNLVRTQFQYSINRQYSG